MSISEKILKISSDSFIDLLTVGLKDSGHIVFQDLFRPEFIESIQHEIKSIRDLGGFTAAGIGARDTNRKAPEIRRDGTHWISSEERSPPQCLLVDFLESVRGKINERLFLGLWDWEGHYAIYPPGAFYRKHLDRFSNDSRRAISVVLFFNSKWKPEEGGALRLFTANDSFSDIFPEAGTAVFFMSDQIPHEVLETHRERFSFAGWFRTR